MIKEIARNKKAYYNYEVLETLEAGIVLSGPEVKSVKKGNIDLTHGYISIDKDQIPWLINVVISPYQPAKEVQENYNPSQPRKLLLKKKEISYLIGKIKMKGLTIIPLRVYNKNGLIKVEIGLAKGKKKVDKREKIKKKEIEKRIKQELKFKTF